MAKKTLKGRAKAGATRETSTQLTNAGNEHKQAVSATMTANSTPSTFMDIREIAELFGTTPDAIHRSRANGNFFPAVRIAGRLLWRRDLIELGLAEQLERDEAALAERRLARLAKRGSIVGTTGA